jgi:hypothetical protein
MNIFLTNWLHSVGTERHRQEEVPWQIITEMSLQEYRRLCQFGRGGQSKINHVTMIT